MPSKPPNAVRIEHRAEQHIRLAGITAAAILQLIKSRYAEALSQRQLDLLFQRLLLQPLKAEEMTLLIADVLLQPIMLLIKYPTSQ